MGSGYFDPGAYDAHLRGKAASGQSTFAYSDGQVAGQRTVHPDLDPRWRNGAGLKIRESRDSAEHPNSTPIVVVLDVTGTMSSVVGAIHASLKNLYSLLQTRGYVSDPQIMFMAIGDSSMTGGRMCDEVPLQVAQFESDIRAALQLELMVIEGGGGGQKRESYQNAAYFLAEHTAHDAWEQRGKKGYVYFIGDELAWPNVEPDEMFALTGDTLARPIPTAEVFARVKQRYETFFILPDGANYGGDRQVLGYWRGLLGENVLQLSEPNGAAELIALSVGTREATVDLDQGAQHLADLGVSRNVRQAVVTALAKQPTRTMARASGALPGISGAGRQLRKLRRL
ncbi:MAG: hypothetical protein AB7P40_28430 [Chloroflexota bacterium]